MGAGGTQGGNVEFIIGLIMMIGGGYLLLDSIYVGNVFHFRHAMYHAGSFGITSGMIMIPFLFGVGMIFYNHKNKIGWALAIGSIIALVFGVISNIQFTFKNLSLINILIIFVLLAGGIALFLRALNAHEEPQKK
jgi:hypothetical protein